MLCMSYKVEALRRYNSAMHGRTGVLNGGGTDFGAPVRKAAEEVCEERAVPSRSFRDPHRGLEYCQSIYGWLELISGGGKYFDRRSTCT